MTFRRSLTATVVVALLTIAPHAQPAPAGGIGSIQPGPLKEWLTYISSDELQGRALYSEGLGLAAGYISSHLAEWGVKPAGDDGTYLQVVKVVTVKPTSHASVTVDVNGQTRTFKDGEGVTFSRSMGGKQTVTGDQIQFVGYGVTLPSGREDDYAQTDPKGKVVVWLGSSGPKTSESNLFRLLNPIARNRKATDKGAIATIAPVGGGFFMGRGGRGGSERVSGSEEGTFETVQRYDDKVPPAVTASDDFFEFLFSGSAVKYAELKANAAAQEPLPAFALKGVKVTFNVDVDYAILRTRLTHNVAGIVEGSDPKLKDTYVLYGAHYDHLGYREAPLGGNRCPGDPQDTINNGADDDGSGTVAIMSIARAFALGPKPKRSILFVWHTGEETGLWGSRYNADHPIVALDKMVAQLNIDMVGRNRNDDPKESNTIYVVGSDRISTELHNVNEDANASMSKPWKLDYEMNDPADTESNYTRTNT